MNTTTTTAVKKFVIGNYYNVIIYSHKGGTFNGTYSFSIFNGTDTEPSYESCSTYYHTSEAREAAEKYFKMHYPA